MHWHDRLTTRRLGKLEAWPAPKTATAGGKMAQGGRWWVEIIYYRGWSFLGEKKLMINDDVWDVGASMVMI